MKMISKIDLDEDEIAKVDEEIEELADDGDASEKKKGRWARVSTSWVR